MEEKILFSFFHYNYKPKEISKILKIDEKYVKKVYKEYLNLLEELEKCIKKY